MDNIQFILKQDIISLILDSSCCARWLEMSLELAVEISTAIFLSMVLGKIKKSFNGKQGTILSQIDYEGKHFGGLNKNV